jgi:excisionase family DNA binding protein
VPDPRREAQPKEGCGKRRMTAALPARIGAVTASSSPRFLSLDDVAEELALTRAHMYSLVRSGELPAIQVGPKRVWRIERVKLEEYIEAQYASAREAIERVDVPPSTDDDEG